ncbi:MAG: DUF2808 domain-containing protein [Leptolyngbyaceae cyanobacterium SM1_1_3]|nr:DUF2808 domain-containing protein [Leptolyngbyaceae cyanobacterium SM1_1_3]NJN03132.1 DUF2808 domain-containing protein [Leptolyngbyaceae cyanobacterium RM1_1_2]NJO09164.1 DUF2808 domain-containing protein [Leptolyngbyaceae cyanobacterium SL_1_1]
MNPKIFATPSLWLSLLLGAAVPGLSQLPAAAVEILDGAIAFVQLPQLLEATTTRNRTQTRNATYYFTLDLPEAAGEPLSKVVIAPSNFRLTSDLRYRLENSTAFVRDARGARSPISLGSVTQDENSAAITFTFDPPVQPGQVVTLSLSPVRNPRWGGTYLFGVTAFPAGESVQSQFAGYGQLRFYESDGSDNFRP